MTIKEQITLAPYTTWKIGGPADFLVEAATLEDILEAAAWACAKKVSVTVMGNGSNSLVADTGIRGLVIIARNDQMEWDDGTVVAGAGVKLGQLIAGALQHNRGGLDWLIGVPGTVGGSIFGNAGSRDHGLGEYATWVEVLRPDGRREKIPGDQCKFTYHTSGFEHDPSIILQTELKLPEVDPAMERTLLADAAKKKNTNQPLTNQSAGCMFKNPKVDTMSLPPELQAEVHDNGTISAWRLIHHVGLQGFQLGQVQISPQHASFLLNLGGGTADQVVQVISLVKQKVRDTLGVQLGEEIRYLGF